MVQAESTLSLSGIEKTERGLSVRLILCSRNDCLERHGMFSGYIGDYASLPLDLGIRGGLPSGGPASHAEYEGVNISLDCISV